MSTVAILKSAGYKSTPKRLAILEIMGEDRVYLSPEDVWARLKHRFARIGLPTVYRNLEDLAEAGLIMKILHPDRRLYYYLCSNTSHHHHFVCLSCRRVEDIDFCGIDVMVREVEYRLKGTVEQHLVQVSGYCRSCKEKLR